MPSLVLCASLWLAAAAPVPGPAPCAHLAWAAEQAACDASKCVLRGDARVRCDDGRWLRADEVTVALDADGGFGEAVARGEVTYVDGAQLLTAAQVRIGRAGATLAVGHAQLSQYDARAPAVAQDAFLAVQAPPVAALVPHGARKLWAQGSLARTGPSTLRVTNAAVTPCDCGPGAPPTWRLDAPRVDVDGQRSRATVYWPRLRVHVGGGRLVPITPPLLPISLPLAPRAAGLLAPRVQFLGGRVPTVDLPVFVPLGPSWDVTASPGVRPDWRAAPRLQLRLRGAPHPGGHWHTTLAATYDRRAARVRRPQGGGAPPRLRVSLLHGHRLRAGAPSGGANGLGSGLQWQAEGSWQSDGEVLRDLSLSPAERAASYLPMRTAVAAADGGGQLWLGAEGFARTGNAPGSPRAPSLQRLPVLRLGWPHLALGPHWAVGASVDWTTLAPLRPISADVLASLAVPAAPNGADGAALPAPDVLQAEREDEARRTLAGRQLVGATLGLRGRLAAGGLVAGARLGLESVAAAGGGAGPRWALTPSGRAEVGLPLARPYAGVVHALEPKVALLWVHALRLHQAAQTAVADATYDGRLARQNALQAALLLEQRWRRRAGAAPGWEGALSVRLPADVAALRPLRPSAEGRVVGGGAWQLDARLGLDPAALRFRRPPGGGQRTPGGVGASLQDVDLAGRVALPAATHLSVRYQRLSPGAERLERTAFALAAPKHTLADPGAATWLHTVHLGAAHLPAVGLRIAYEGSIQLPRPNPRAPTGDVACVRGRACAGLQVLRVGYGSRCRCWRVDASLSAMPQQVAQTFRVLVTFDVAGYSVMTPS